MLELIQSQFRTVVLVVLVLMLSAVFILQFGGPQAQGCASMFQNSGYAARIEGRTLTNGDFRAAYALPGFNRYPTKNARTLRLRELTMDGLVERELLANAAEEMGLHVSRDEVMDDLLERGIVYLNPPVNAPAGYPGPEIDVGDQFRDRNGVFSARRMRGYINNALRRSTDEFVEWQVRERLAFLARRAIEQQVTVGREEVRAAYVRNTERAQLEYVQFRPTYYRDRVQPTDADLTAWMAEHAEEVDAEYTRQRHRYTGLEPQVRARHILIKAAEDAPAAERAAARARAEAILARVRRGEDFAAVARAESQDEGSARRGGDLGFNPRGRMVAPFDEAQFATEPGQITDHVVETRFGFHVIKVEGRREGDVPEAEAKREVAEGLYVRARAGELARQDAERALAYLREGHTMEELDRRLLEEQGVTPSGGSEPPERDALAPQVRESRRFGRTETPISGAFDAAPLTRAAFELTTDAPLPEAPMQLGDDWFVFRLKERTEATEEGFTEEVQRRLADELLSVKRIEALRSFVTELRRRAERRGAIRIDEAILRYGDESPEDSTRSEERESALPVRRNRSVPS